LPNLDLSVWACRRCGETVYDEQGGTFHTHLVFNLQVATKEVQYLKKAEMLHSIVF